MPPSVRQQHGAGFTFLELLLVVFILSAVALGAVSVMGNADQ